MKKILFLIFSVAAFLTFSVSCNKAEQDTDIVNPSEEKPVPQDATKIRFSISSASDGQGKATLNNDGSVTWNEGDQVTVYAVGGEETLKQTVAVKEISGKTAVVETTELPGGLTYYAVFPADVNATISGDVITVSMSAQDGTGNNKRAVAKAKKETEGYSLLFRNVCSLLKFNISSNLTSTIKKVELVGQDGNAISYGQVAYNFDGNTASSSGSSVKSISRSVNTAGTYYITLAPGVEMANGFMLKLLDKNNKVEKLFFKDGPFTTKTNTITEIVNFETKLYTNLSKDETANCYLINSADGSKFCFYAKTKGNGVVVPEMTGDFLKTDLATASVTYLWSTLNTSTKPASDESIVKSVIYHKAGYASFEYVSTGNVILAAKNSAKTIIWSWHLWLPEDKVENVVHQISSGVMNGFNMLNANLGALKKDRQSNNTLDFGFFYQWGRKDPFVGAALSNRTTASATFAKMHGQQRGEISHDGTTIGGTNALAYTIQNPTTFISAVNDENIYRDWYGHKSKQFRMWAADKTMYDPCPPGYKVPPVRYGPWGKFADNTTWDSTYKGRRFTNKAGEVIWHPAAGYLTRYGNLRTDAIFVHGYYWGTDDDANPDSEQGLKEINSYWYGGSDCDVERTGARVFGMSVRCCRSNEYHR